MHITSQSVTLDAAGMGQVELGPTVYGVEWDIELMSSTVNTGSETELNVYRQTVAPTALIAHSTRANNDQNDDKVHLRNLEKIIFVWTGGTPGAVATIILEGEIERAV